MDKIFKNLRWVGALILLTLVLAACTQAAPETVEVEVTRVQTEQVEVPIEVTRIVEVEGETVVEVEEIVVTATPEPAAEAPAEEGGGLKIGIVTFLSGGAAAPFGVPARNGFEVLIQQINAGAAPAPYDMPGIGGVPIEAVFVDEAGGADTQVAELRRLILDEKVDLVIGYISSGDCSALAPVVEELQTLVVFFDCGTNAIFEEIVPEPHYLFRTSGHQILDNVGAARYVAENFPEVTSISGINQDYAWGHDSWNTFSSSMQQLNPAIQVQNELFPKIYAGEYSAEISELQATGSNLIHSSFWGGDLEAFVIQSTGVALETGSTLLLTTGDTMLPRLGRDVPPGIIVAARGPHGALAPDSALNDWFVGIYSDRYSTRPVYSAYHAAQALLGVKAAYEKAIADNGLAEGELPDVEQVIVAFEGLEFDTPSGLISMALANGHQAVEGTAYGVTGDFNPETDEVELLNVVTYPPACVNPPAGVTSPDWIASGFEGADCP
ncbi:MAG: ABC transporter substrate-binding protein [Anaerolineae bacterium]